MEKLQKLTDLKTLNKIITKFSRSINTNTKLQATKSDASTLEPLDEKSNGKEIRIGVPWGHIAGKWYGAEATRPILMAHGWQDNCATFDKLIPLLPKHLSYLSFDFPGHGLSSPLPAGMIYSYILFVNVLIHIRNHFKWDKFSFCSHSMGAQISSIYAALFPDECDLLICIDETLKPALNNSNRLTVMQKLTKESVQLDALYRNGTEPPGYSYDECIDRWIKGTSGSLDRESVQILMKRGTLPSKTDPNKVYFSRDIRLKLIDFWIANLSNKNYEDLVKRTLAPHLYVRSNKNPLNVKQDEAIQQAINIYTKSNPKFEWFSVDAPHHLHLTHSELISKKLSEFINKYRPRTE